MKIIILNAAPSAGKDTIAEAAVQKQPNSVKEQFKEPLYGICAAIYGMDEKTFREIATSTSLKETPFTELYGKSPRQVMIEVSEDVLKPFYGKSYFGDLLRDRLLAYKMDKYNVEYIFISDGGFVEEVEPLIETFGKENVMIAKMLKAGCDFKNDSRRYLSDLDESLKEIEFELDNNGTVHQTVETLFKKVREL